MVIDPNQHDHFVLRQRIRMVINQYEFFLSENDKPFCFVEQARFKFKEDIRFYTDNTKAVELMRIKARQRFDPWATYDVTAADGTRIGEIQKAFGRSLIRSTYLIHAPNGTVTASERNLGVALFRRLVGLVLAHKRTGLRCSQGNIDLWNQPASSRDTPSEALRSTCMPCRS